MEGPRVCPRCGASDPTTTLLTSMVWYFACRRCEHRWRTDVKSKYGNDGDQEYVTDDARVFDVESLLNLSDTDHVTAALQVGAAPL